MNYKYFMNTHKTIEERVAELEGRVAKLEASSPVSHVELVDKAKVKTVSAKEFLMTKELKTDTQKTLVLGYYLEYVEGMGSFNSGDLETAFRSAKESLPANINDTVNKNIARGLIMEAKEKKESKKAWVLTSTGEKYVEGELNK